MVFVCHYEAGPNSDQVFIDLENATDEEKEGIMFTYTTGYLDSSDLLQGFTEDGQAIFSKDLNREMGEMLPFTLGDLSQLTIFKESADSYTMPYGDMGYYLSHTRLIDYKVEGNEIIITGCLEGYAW